MGKSKHSPSNKAPASVNQPQNISLDDTRKDADLWFRVQVLLYDLANIRKDTASQMRLSSTTNELYISEPYLSESEANRVRLTTVRVATKHESDDEAMERSDVEASDDRIQVLTIEDAIHQRLANFFQKRKASGDARPCGPHDMLPVYLDVFGIDKEDLKNERFLSRLQRSGLGLSVKAKEVGPDAHSKSAKSGKQRGR